MVRWSESTLLGAIPLLDTETTRELGATDGGACEDPTSDDTVTGENSLRSLLWGLFFFMNKRVPKEKRKKKEEGDYKGSETLCLGLTSILHKQYYYSSHLRLVKEVPYYFGFLLLLLLPNWVERILFLVNARCALVEISRDAFAFVCLFVCLICACFNQNA